METKLFRDIQEKEGAAQQKSAEHLYTNLRSALRDSERPIGFKKVFDSMPPPARRDYVSEAVRCLLNVEGFEFKCAELAGAYMAYSERRNVGSDENLHSTELIARFCSRNRK